MPPTKLTKAKTYHIDDGAKRGPLTLAQVRFHPKEPCLFAACGDRRLACWNLNDKETTVKNLAAVPGKLVCPHEVGWIRCVDVSPDGRWLATGGSDRQLKLWAWTEGKPADKAAHEVNAHDGWVEGVAFAPDGKWLVTVGADHVVKVWDTTNLKAVQTLTGHTNVIRDVAWAADGSVFVTGGEDGNLFVWEAQKLDRIRTINYGGANEQYGQNPSLSGVHRLHLSHDGRWLAVAGGKSVVLFDVATGHAVAEDKCDTQVAFSPNADVFACGANNVKVFLYEATKLQPAKPDKNGKPGRPGPLAGKELAQIKLGDFALGMRFSADGQRLALGRNDGKVEVWEVA